MRSIFYLEFFEGKFRKYSKVSKICSACAESFFRVSYMFKPTVNTLRILENSQLTFLRAVGIRGALEHNALPIFFFRDMEAGAKPTIHISFSN